MCGGCLGSPNFMGGSGGMGCFFLAKGLETETSKWEHRCLPLQQHTMVFLLFRFMRLYLSIIGINLWENGVLSEKNVFYIYILPELSMFSSNRFRISGFTLKFLVHLKFAQMIDMGLTSFFFVWLYHFLRTMY